MRAILSSVLLLSAPVAALAATPLAVHPLVVADGGDAEAAELAPIFEAEVAALHPSRADGERVGRFVAENGSCAAKPSPEECLGRLARAVFAEHAVLVTITLFSPRLILTARMVRPDGSTASHSRSEFEKRAGERDESVREAFRRFFATDLRIPERAASPPGEDPGRGWKRSAAVGLGAGGAVLVAGGVYFLAQSGGAWQEVDALYPNGQLPTAEQGERLRELKARAQGQQTVGAVLLGAGVAAAAGGAALLLLDRSGGESISLAPAPGGLGVFLRW